MTVHDPKPEGRAETIRLPGKGGHDRRTGAQYAADLALETDRTLRRSSNWRAGQPLDQGERWPWKTVDQLGSRSGIPAHGGRWPTGGERDG